MNRTKRTKTIGTIFTLMSIMIIAGTLFYAYSFSKKTDVSSEKQMPNETKGSLSLLSEQMNKNDEAQTDAITTEDTEQTSQQEAVLYDDETQRVSISVEGFNIGTAIWPVSSKDIVMDY